MLPESLVHLRDWRLTTTGECPSVDMFVLGTAKVGE